VSASTSREGLTFGVGKTRVVPPMIGAMSPTGRTVYRPGTSVEVIV
jgi:hypothetical protein